MKDIALLVGRIFVIFIFMKAGFDKISNYSNTLAYMKSFKVPLSDIALIISIIIEIGCSFLILLGYKTRYAAMGLVIFLVIVTPIFHNIFRNPEQMIHFLKNIAIIGGLLQIAATGGGKYSLESMK
jgi:putative oxidoreductase